jgi:dephospho-CoA kinase
MMVVGITGGIGSGKSIVCSVFRALGIPVYEADSEAKKLYERAEVIAEIKKQFGAGYFSASGELDKKKFAELVFSDEASLKKINAVIHPLVKKSFREWKREQEGKPYVLKEAAILFESGTSKGCDKVITVSAPEDLRLRRTMQRDSRTKEEVEKIIRSQWSDEEKIRRSDYVIVNDEVKLVLPQVLSVHSALLDAGGVGKSAVLKSA